MTPARISAFWVTSSPGVDNLNRQGEIIFTLERLFNLAAGLSAKDDTLPKRFLKEPMPDGPCKGQVFEQDQLLPDYYRMRGWDDTGRPLPAKLAELGIPEDLFA